MNPRQTVTSAEQDGFFWQCCRSNSMSSRQAIRAQNRRLQEQQKASKVERSVGTTATRFLLIRHGETAWNAEHRLQGQKNPALNHLGREQAQALADRLSQSEKWDAIYSSDLDRAAQTAIAISNSRSINDEDCSHQIILRPAFRERCLGVLEGLTFAEAAKSEAEGWAALCSDREVPGGESYAAVEARASQGLLAIAQQHSGQTVIVVTHGGVLQALYKHASGREYAGKFKNCAINTLWRDGDAWKLGFWGDTSHLDGVGVQSEAFGGGKGG